MIKTNCVLKLNVAQSRYYFHLENVAEFIALYIVFTVNHSLNIQLIQSMNQVEQEVVITIPWCSIESWQELCQDYCKNNLLLVWT